MNLIFAATIYNFTNITVLVCYINGVRINEIKSGYLLIILLLIKEATIFLLIVHI